VLLCRMQKVDLKTGNVEEIAVPLGTNNRTFSNQLIHQYYTMRLKIDLGRQSQHFNREIVGGNLFQLRDYKSTSLNTIH
jgi:hypothetical protein